MKTIRLKTRTSGTEKKKYHYILVSGNGRVLVGSPPSGFKTAKERDEAVQYACARGSRAEVFTDSGGEFRAKLLWKHDEKDGPKTAGITTEGYTRSGKAYHAIAVIQKNRRVLDEKGQQVV